MNKIALTLAKLPRYGGDSEYLIEAVEGLEGVYAGRSRLNHAVFLVADQIDPDRTIQTGALTIEMGVSFEAMIGDFHREFSRCLVISLLQPNEELELYFSEICLTLWSQIKGGTKHEATIGHLKTLAGLFGLSQPSREMIKGLWGELKFASMFTDVDQILSSWHEGNFGRVDYQTSKRGWEVKTVESNQRRHRFNLKQMLEPEDLVVSLVVEEAPTGQSLQQLIDYLLPFLSLELSYKLRLRTLGYSFSKDVRNIKFRLMSQELRPLLYKIGDLPRPEIGPVNSAVISNVNFDLHITEAINSIELLDESASRLAAAAVDILLPGDADA